MTPSRIKLFSFRFPVAILAASLSLQSLACSGVGSDYSSATSADVADERAPTNTREVAAAAPEGEVPAPAEMREGVHRRRPHVATLPRARRGLAHSHTGAGGAVVELDIDTYFGDLSASASDEDAPGPVGIDADNAPGPSELNDITVAAIPFGDDDDDVRKRELAFASSGRVIDTQPLRSDDAPSAIHVESRPHASQPSAGASEAAAQASCGSGAGSYAFGCFDCSRADATRAARFYCDPRYLTPNKRRLLGLAGAGVLVGGFAGLFATYGLTVLQYHAAVPIWAFFAVNGPETALGAFSLVFQEPPPIVNTAPADLRRLAVVIPVNGPAKDLTRTIDSLNVVGIPNDQIFIVENMNPPGTPGGYAPGTSLIHQQFAANKFPGLHFFVMPDQGSKTGAEYAGIAYAHSLGFDFAVAGDDDIYFQSRWTPQLDLMIKGDNVKMIAYPIAPLQSEEGQVNWLVDQQGREYASAANAKHAQTWLSGTVYAPHGAVKTVDIRAYLEFMRNRPVKGEFLREDQAMGAAFTWAGANIVMAGGVPVLTEVPDNWFKYFDQRHKSWAPGAYRAGPMHAETLCTRCQFDCSTSGICRFIARKAFQAQTVATLAMGCVCPCVTASLASDPMFWVVSSGILGVGAAIDTCNDSFCRPHYGNRTVCVPRNVATSLARNVTGIAYRVLEQVNVSCGAACNYLGVGASPPEEYWLIRPYPQWLSSILHDESLGTLDAMLRALEQRMPQYVVEVDPSAEQRRP